MRASGLCGCSSFPGARPLFCRSLPGRRGLIRAGGLGAPARFVRVGLGERACPRLDESAWLGFAVLFCGCLRPAVVRAPTTPPNPFANLPKGLELAYCGMLRCILSGYSIQGVGVSRMIQNNRAQVYFRSSLQEARFHGKASSSPASWAGFSLIGDSK